MRLGVPEAGQRWVQEQCPRGCGARAQRWLGDKDSLEPLLLPLGSSTFPMLSPSGLKSSCAGLTVQGLYLYRP